MSILPKSDVLFSEEELCAASPLSLSFIGDGVHTLYIRTKTFDADRYKNGAMHFDTIKEVRAEKQAEMAKKMEILLTERELYIFKKAKSAKVKSVPTHATTYQYNLATGFEAVIGYLYLSGQNERLGALMDALYEEKK